MQSDLTHLETAHPLLKKLFIAVAGKFPIQVLDSERGKAAQDAAFAHGFSKVRYGNSAHNYNPSLAVDVVPLPLDWNNRKPFYALAKIVLPIAKSLAIPIRWGGDFNQDGNLSNDTFVDLPHYELNPWRDYKSQSKLAP